MHEAGKRWLFGPKRDRPGGQGGSADVTVESLWTSRDFINVLSPKMIIEVPSQCRLANYIIGNKTQNAKRPVD